MISNGFILDRRMVTIIKDICSKRSIDFKSFSDDWILKLNKGGATSLVYGYRFGINNSSSESVAQDKVATYQVLDAAGIAAVPHVIVSTRATTHEQWKSLAQEWGKFIVKPLHGGGGRGLRLFNDINGAMKHMDTHPELEWCVSPFLELQSETRSILLDGEILVSFEKTNPHVHDGIPMFNLRLGAKASNIEPSVEIKNISQSAQRALGLRLTAVDIIRTKDSKLRVLELNDGFSLEHYLRQADENREKAIRVYETIIDSLFP